MPQDKRRSISYRSFVTCDDPKGIECGAIRKSKNNSQKKEQEKIQNTSKTIKEEKEKKEMVIRGITREIETSPVTFQLLEVSKEAEKLNHVINSWSNNIGMNQNNTIAKNLLRGALDLQESLAMLGRLQDRSSFMLGLPKKSKQKLEGGTFDGMVSEVRGLERSWNRRHSRNSVDEMRNVVRDSLLRQNVMVTNPVFEEHYYDQTKMGSPDLLPSTSSSQSSMVYSSNFPPSDSSISSSTTSQKKKGNDSNLIVKLMGLESFPSSPRRQSKPVYDNDSPRLKRIQFRDQDVGMKQRSVDEILEKLKFKGLLRNGSMNGLKISSQESEVFCPGNNSWVDEKPPIVVMKPIRYPCLDFDTPYIPNSWGEDDNIRKSRHISRSAEETVRNEEYFSSKKGASSKVKASVNSQRKLQKKQAEVKIASEVEKITSTRRKGQEKKDAKASDLLSSRDQEKCTAMKIKRQENGKSVCKNQGFGQQKMAPVTMLQNKKRGNSERKTNGKPGLVVEDKRICEDTKTKCEVIYQEESYSRGDGKLVLPSVNSIIVTDNDEERCQIPIRDYDLDSQTKLFDTPEEHSYVLIDKKASHFDDKQSSYSEITSVSTSEHCSVDQLCETQNLFHEVTLITTHENGLAVHHDTNLEGSKCLENSINPPQGNVNDTLRRCITPKMKLKAFLLSNTEWANHVEELFGIQVNHDLVPCVIDDGDRDLESSRLLIDCANEVLGLKSLHCLQACLPHPIMYTQNSQTCPSLDCLLEEVCNRIEELRCYSRPCKDDLPSDDLYVLLERDLRLRSGIWGVGWRGMYTQDEVEQVIVEVDRFVLSKLIDEVLVDFVK